MSKKLILPLMVLVLVLSSCTIQITMPTVATTTAPVTEPIQVPLPSDPTQTTNLTFSFGAGDLKLAPGSSSLVEGTATYNLPELKPRVTVDGNLVHISQGDFHWNTIPDLTNIKNEWDLQLGSSPLNLKIEAGAYDAEYHLGGLALVNLTIEDGAAKSELSFDQPNQAEMNLLQYGTGASSVSITGLANANFASMVFESGAGTYTLDFSGEWKRDATINIETGVSDLTLIIPQGIPVQLTMDKALAVVSKTSGWTENGTVYSQPGTGPQLIIMLDIGAGSLNISR